MINSKKKVEFGDFQTPESLAKEILGCLASQGILPKVILEPTCGLALLFGHQNKYFHRLKYTLLILMKITLAD